mmetsp:Transcript_29527/g.26114  ORF Transcript_29527/g.26114 Transcript_29527/m.26114 type:complete len:98 (+) Transcript_29527:189-482(+)
MIDYSQIGNKNNTNLPYEETLYLEYYLRLRIYNMSILPFIISTIGAVGFVLKFMRFKTTQYNSLFLTVNNKRSTSNTLVFTTQLLLSMNAIAFTTSS